jgi:DNA modification methylase
MLELASVFIDTGDMVIDSFMDSGTTLVACAKVARMGIGI